METVASGLRFPEGPIAMADGSVLLVEIERGTLSRVGPDGTVEVVADCGGGPNGAAIGPDGKIYVCNNGGFDWVEQRGDGKCRPCQSADYRGGSIQRVDLASGKVETSTPTAAATRCAAPTTSCSTPAAASGSPTRASARARDRDRGGLYYARADGSEVREVIYPLNHPNGVGLSPAGDRVYVAETETARVFSWALSGPGEIAGLPRSRDPGRRCSPGSAGWQLLDSLAVDADGNVCVATIRNGGITVISPDGAPHRPRADRRWRHHQHLLRRPGPAHGVHHRVADRAPAAHDLAPARSRPGLRLRSGLRAPGRSGAATGPAGRVCPAGVACARQARFVGEVAMAGRVTVGTVEELVQRGCLTGKVGNQPICVFWSDGEPFALDDRCPHMGFPLHRGRWRAGW